MKSSTTTTMITLCMMMGIMCAYALPKTGGYVQTSYISTNGGTASGAAESSVTGADGVKKGECSYTKSDGEFISIKYEESSDGNLIDATVNGESNSSNEDSLKECRSAIEKLQGNVDQIFTNTQEHAAAFENTFQNQMDNFNRQQQEFQQLQDNFFQNMNDFMKG